MFSWTPVFLPTTRQSMSLPFLALSNVCSEGKQSSQQTSPRSPKTVKNYSPNIMSHYHQYVKICSAYRIYFGNFQDNLSSLAVSRQECLKAVKMNVKVAQERQKRQYDQKHSLSPKFNSGVKVLKKDFRRSRRKGGGMDHRWLGPYVIVKDLSKGFFSLRNVETGKMIQRVHGAHLKIYFTSCNGQL